MRVNVYAEEMTDRVEIVSKTINGQEFTGVRFYLELPVRIPVDRNDPARGYVETQGPFIHGDGDDDSAAVTFWGKRDASDVFKKALELLAAHHAARVKW